ncbi:DUF262 domain-containing protein [Diaminobutyricibacter sp. McL0618]|uniref:DUF262 domain-containing protein n=1 Tax=Leifsonia sp. McL0618 TaxID=3415677 RepID=UPI003CE70599
MAKIENFQYTIQEAFKQNFYAVPDYQREYVWREREVGQLLQDIDEQLDVTSDTPYFIGMVLVSPTSPSSFDVIDGQQRLTTLFLLLCAIRRRFGQHGSTSHGLMEGLLSSVDFGSDGEAVARLRLDPRYENAAEVTARLASNDLSPEALRGQLRTSGIPLIGSVARLATAYEVTVEFLDDNYPTLSDLQSFWGFVSNRVVFIQITTDVSSALKIFETINERGVGLSPMDLLKNLLFTSVNPTQFTELKNAWKDVTGPLEKAHEKPLRFLRYFLMANYPIGSKDEIIREDGIYDWLTEKRNAHLVGYESKPFLFVGRLKKAVDLYIGFLRGHGNDGQPSPSIKRLQMLTGGAFYLHNVLLLAAAPLPQAAFEHFVQQLENFLFSFIFTKSPSKDLERSFSTWADELRQICEVHDSTNQLGQLNDFIRTHFQTGVDAKRRELSDALLRYSTASMQQYRTVYLLARLTEYVDRAFTGSSFKGVQDLTPYRNLEVEHVLPENPQPGGREAWANQNPEADYDEFKLRLGNLALLEKPLNIIASNHPFDLKVVEYLKSSHYLTRSIAETVEVGANTSVTSINSFLASYSNWNAETIVDRQLRIAELATVVWRVNSD